MTSMTHEAAGGDDDLDVGFSPFVFFVVGSIQIGFTQDDFAGFSNSVTLASWIM